MDSLKQTRPASGSVVEAGCSLGRGLVPGPEADNDLGRLAA